MQPLEALQKYFGYSEFRPAQGEIVSSILNGENVLAILPTGGGKSICYQLPALLSPNFSIVISPLIALMKDQVDTLNKKEKISAFINSSLNLYDEKKILLDVTNSKIKILYLSPEKLSNKSFAEQLRSLAPLHIFIDEAHCISEWGHNFRPSYRKIKEFVDFINVKSVSAFTATATEEVRKDIIDQLGLINPKIFVRGFERNNFHLNVIHTSHKKEKIVELIKGKTDSTIIYTATRKSTEEVARFLRSNRIESVYYHAGLSSELRRMIQDDFLSGRVKVIAATNAFGMGIDKSDIRTIFHYNLPGSIENYYQEIGRAGRDGKDANIFLLYDEKDRLIQEYFIDSSNPTKQQIENIYQLICDCGKVALGNISDKEILLDNAFYNLLEIKKINPRITDSSIRILEESGYLHRRSDFEMNHYGQFLLEPARLNNFIKSFTNGEVKDLIVLLAREYGSKIFGTKISINIKRFSEMLDISEDSIIELLQSMNDIGIFLYKRPSLSPSVKMLLPRIEVGNLKLNLSRVNTFAKHAHNKLRKMIDYAFVEECRFKFILEYFGQFNNNYKCGKCDVCTGSLYNSPVMLEYLEEIILQTIHESKTPIKKKNIIQILTGKTKNLSLKKFSTFETCTHFNTSEIEKSIAHLQHNQFLICVDDVLSLSEKSVDHLIQVEDEPVPLSSDNKYEKELKLFNQLRQIRKEAADKFGQQSKIICPDEILREIARIRPTTHTEILNVKGFNQRMFNKVGEEFLAVIKNFPQL
jgi:ATP-dependent DNA helicase RecQ